MTNSMALLAVTALLVSIGFVNCSEVQWGALNGGSTQPTAAANNGGGVPYDGKVYALEGEACPDGSATRARIVFHDGGQARLVRENCQDITPQAIPSQDYTITADDSLVYRQQIYRPENLGGSLKPLTKWYYQLTGVTAATGAAIYDIDMFNTTANEVSQLKATGHLVLCYISAGSFESYRPDASQFPASVKGRVLGGGSSDLWLDTRSATVRSIMLARLDLAVSKGCQGVDFDNVDAYESDSGFPLSAVTQIDFNRFLAAAAHDRGLSVALNNAGSLAADLAQNFDLAIAEQCFENGECAKFQPFASLGKAVLDIEYTSFSAAQCSSAQSSGISLVFANTALDGSVYQPCP